MVAPNFQYDPFHRITKVSWASGDIAILDAIEMPRRDTTAPDYILDMAAQVKILKPFAVPDFVGTGTLGPNITAYDSEPHLDTGYEDDGHTRLPTKEQFAKGYVFYTRTKIFADHNGGYYANWIVNLGKLRADMPNKNNKFVLDMLMQREYFHATPGLNDAWPGETATWTLRIYSVPIDKFAVDENGHIDPIEPGVIPLAFDTLKVKLPQEAEPGWKTPTNAVIAIPQHALYDGDDVRFATP